MTEVVETFKYQAQKNRYYEKNIDDPFTQEMTRYKINIIIKVNQKAMTPWLERDID